MIFRSVTYGFVGAMALLAVYFSVLFLISGWSFTLDQFGQFWYFVTSLAIGFGIQIGLYAHLKHITHTQRVSGSVLGVSGTTSTVAMLSCCAHYLVNILPVIGVVGAVSIIAQYQVELFWVGLAFNAGGIIYIGRKIINVSQLS
ncbi:MAG: hypothetical protein Q8P70_01470 [bacterium]|nr:hypothetical protein [bacterium]MDZ4221823.1 hypothetical protein [Patescibacteria group bacterium]